MKRKMLLVVLRYFWGRCRRYLLNRTFLFNSKIVNTYYVLTREQFNLGEDPLYGESALLDNRLM